MANHTGTDGRDRPAENVSETSRSIMKRSKDINVDGALRIRTESSPTLFGKNRGERTHKFVDISGGVRDGMSGCARSLHGREGEVQESLGFLGKLLKSRMKTWVTSEGAKTGIRR